MARQEPKLKRWTDRYKDCPYCLRWMPHTQADHEAALRRAAEATRGDS